MISIGSSRMTLPPRLVASDLDGTLLTPEGRISPATTLVLARLAECGIDFVVATARPPAAFGPLVGLPAPVTVIAQNGAVVIEKGSAARRVRGVVDPDALAALVDRVEARSTRPARLAVQSVLDTGDRYVAEPGFPSPQSFRYETAPLRAILRVPATRALLLYDPEAEGVDVAAAQDDRITVTRSTAGPLLEVSAGGVTKASALAEVAGGLGVDPADVVAFGDMPNDIGMLTWAGLGVAMEGAPQEVLDAADDVAPGNGGDGVARYLDRLLEGTITERRAAP